MQAILEACEGVFKRQVEDTCPARLEAEHLAPGADGEGDLQVEDRLADLRAAGAAGEAGRDQLIDHVLERLDGDGQQVGDREDFGGGELSAAAHEGDQAGVGAVEFLIERRDGGRAAGGVGVKELLHCGGPAAVGAGAGLGQGGGRGAVKQAANGSVGQLAGALGGFVARGIG